MLDLTFRSSDLEVDSASKHYCFMGTFACLDSSFAGLSSSFTHLDSSLAYSIVVRKSIVESYFREDQKIAYLSKDLQRAAITYSEKDLHMVVD